MAHITNVTCATGRRVACCVVDKHYSAPDADAVRLPGNHPLEQGNTMQTHVIISYDGTDNDTDALALGKMFGDAGARISLAYVRHAEEPDAAAEQAAQAQAEELL